MPAQTATRNSPKEVLRFGDQEPQQSQNQLRLENEVNPEYSAFNNPKEQQRPKKHGERSRQIPYSFGGNVDLFKKRRRSKQKLLNRTTTTTVAPIDDQNELSNDIPVISNALPKLTFLEEDQTDRYV